MAVQNRVSFLEKVMKAEKFTDLKFITHDKVFKVHKAIVCQSPVIEAALTGNFVEAATGEIDMTHYLPETVKRMVEFMYTGDYSGFTEPKGDEFQGPSGGGDQVNDENQSPSFNSSSSSATLDFSPPPEPREVPNDDVLSHLRVGSIADYYQLTDLAEMAQDRVKVLLEDVQHETLVMTIPDLITEIIESTNNMPQIGSLVSMAAKSIVALDAWDLITTIHPGEHFRAPPFIRLLLSHCAKEFQIDMEHQSKLQRLSDQRIESTKEYNYRLEALHRKNSQRVVDAADAFLHILLETESRVERLEGKATPQFVIKDLRQGGNIKKRYAPAVIDTIVLGTLGGHVVEDAKGKKVACSLCSCMNS
ncbi:hypothetical protein CDD81_5908 [Ophiocordyceps australis]|uniref:BTB domain-containing protein n=1 Tax=Ophiocordyceps australis TaxID=1399860 RepID=A0A2C5YGE3_9HYPO|nr:hypothetical protein CDD81_5908 [Ophiocordyceps australis]